jgi:hypothetical protein
MEVLEEGPLTADVDVQPHVNQELISVLTARVSECDSLSNIEVKYPV